jgi:VIT1/CCC1 family predicted Fe2+/Mn2+ transporter
VTSVAGAELSAAVIVILGISHLFADGLSMGIGDSMSSQAELDYNNAERKRERWEMDNHMEGEITEMVELYIAKGLSRTDSETIIHTLAKYEDAFLDHMMVEELGLMPPDMDDPHAAIKAGLVTMLSFIVFGAVPLAPYLIALIPGVHISANAQLYSAVVFTVLTLFLLGAFKGKLVEIGQSWWKSGCLMAFNGSFAAFVGFLIGWGMKSIVDTGNADL